MKDSELELPFTSPDRERYFEDYIAGTRHVLGSAEVVEAAMVKYAHAYDPQAIHIDREKAEAGVFGGLIASGWYTGALMMKVFARHYLSNVSSLSSPGLTDLKWLAPVRGGDTLTTRVNILETRRSASKPDRGIVRTLVEVLKQDDTVVMTIDAINFIACRDTD
jgi:acyl dehydratase